MRPIKMETSATIEARSYIIKLIETSENNKLIQLAERKQKQEDFNAWLKEWEHSHLATNVELKKFGLMISVLDGKSIPKPLNYTTKVVKRPRQKGVLDSFLESIRELLGSDGKIFSADQVLKLTKLQYKKESFHEIQKTFYRCVKEGRLASIRFDGSRAIFYGDLSWFDVSNPFNITLKKEHDNPVYSHSTNGQPLPFVIKGFGKEDNMK